MTGERPKGNDGEVFIVTPKRRERERLMPALGGLLKSIRGVQVLGEGETCFKIKVAPGAEFQSALSSDVRNSCFIERAVVFDVATK